MSEGNEGRVPDVFRTASTEADVARLAIEANDAADKRQYDFQMACLASDNEDRSRRHALLRTIIYVGGAVAIALIAALLWLMFRGDEHQRPLAFEAWKILLIGVGGYGVISAVTLPLRKLLDGTGSRK